jgi:intein/homing endonuclease
VTAIVRPSEEECYLYSILCEAADGIDLAEFAVEDIRNEGGRYRLRDYQWCFAGETVIMTKSGYRRIDSVVGPVTLMTDLSGKAVWTEAEVRSFGVQQIWELTVEQYGVRKVIRTTGNHRWFAGGHRDSARRRYSEVQTQDLSPDDFLKSTSPRRITGLRPAPYGIAHGLVWGDGTVSGGGSCNLVLWGEKRNLTRFLPEDGYPVDDPDVSVPGLRHTMLPSIFKEPVRLTESPSYLYGWLAGYFATDGSVSDVDGQCVLNSASLESINLARDVCLRLGIRTGVANYRPPQEGGLSDNCSYSLVIYSQDLAEDFFLKDSHREKWLPFSDRRRYKNRDWKVVSVAPTDAWEAVFCAVVPETHSFILEGYLVTSNCWFSCPDMYQIDQSGRNVGKTESIKLRCLAFPFTFPGKGALLTAPELNHLRPLTDEVEKMLLNTWAARQMMPDEKSAGITRQPHWQARFKNGSSLVSRLPNNDGKGIKGCLAAGTLVLTSRGHVPIEQVEKGDLVLTHRGRWRPVTATFSFAGGEGLRVKGSGHRGIVVSDTHAFYGRRNSNPQRTRNLSDPSWVDAASPELGRWYWAAPTSIPPCPTASVGDAPDEWVAIAGAYVADGNPQRDGGVITCVSITDSWDGLVRVGKVVTEAGFNFSTRPHPDWPETTGRLEICSRPLGRWLVDNFGERAGAKFLPLWLLSGSEGLRRAFWDSYCAGDGTWDRQRQRWGMSTASRRLAADLQVLATSLGYDAGFFWIDPKVTRIRGIELKAKPQRSYRVAAAKHGHRIAEDGLSWGKIQKTEPELVVEGFYDLSVEEDHSYLAEGIFHHNQHVILIEQDEAQDYPRPGWTEIVECLNSGEKGAAWLSHGVTRGVRDNFFEKTQPGSGWTVHRYCLPAGTLIYGVDGPFPIQDAVPGTLVWSCDPSGNLVQRAVLARIENGEKATWEVRAKGGYSLETTSNHPYLILCRDGSRRTRRELAFEWVEAQHLKPGDYLIGIRELDSTGTEIPDPAAVGAMLRDHSPQREIPEWVWRAPRSFQFGFLAGYLMGDGSLAHQQRGQDPWQVSTSSPVMAKQIRALCHYLGLRATRLVSKMVNNPISGPTLMHGFYVYADDSWFRQIPRSYSSVRDGQALGGLDKRLIARRVERSAATGRIEPTYDITVDEQHNYFAEGICTHNTAMHRPTWSDEERQAKIVEYGGSRSATGYIRNIYGSHADAANAVFLLANLVARTDLDPGSVYNNDVYRCIRLNSTLFREGAPDEERESIIRSLIEVPPTHFTGYSQKVRGEEVGSPRGYSAYWGGCDVGLVQDPSEVLLAGARKGEDFLEIILRVQMKEINSTDQKLVFKILFEIYGDALKGFGIDSTGLGRPIWDELTRKSFGDRIHGFNFSENRVESFEERELREGETRKDLARRRPFKEISTDLLRNKYIDGRRIRFPSDKELSLEWGGVTYHTVLDPRDPYTGKKVYSGGSLHTLDAGRCLVGAIHIPPLEALLEEKKNEAPVPTFFPGAIW